MGITPLTAGEDLEFSRKWVEQGFGGEMRFLENPKRHDPRRLLPSAKSVICVGLIYNTDYPYSTQTVDSTRKAVGNQQQPICTPTSSSWRGRPPASRVAGEGDEVRFSDSNSQVSKPTAWISRYAWGRDYHAVMRPMLEEFCATIESEAPGTETRAYVDTGPIVERAFARYSGIGWMGKNTCIINQEKGSWFFLGVILTSLEVAPDFPAPDRCGTCTRCLEACPTGALVEPYVMDATRCISYLTIELKGSIPTEFRAAMGANVFGCDICQDVCPWNVEGSGQSSVVSGQWPDNESQMSVTRGQCDRRRSIAVTSRPEFRPVLVGPLEEEAVPRTPTPVPSRQPPAPEMGHPKPLTFSLFNPSLEDLGSITEKDFRRIFRNSPVKRAKCRGWLRNLCVAMGNSGDSRLVPWLEEARRHADAVVREHAAWALERLKGEAASRVDGAPSSP